MKLIECHFIFKYAEKLEDCTYLTKQGTWSKDINDVQLMSEQQASDTCREYDLGACGSCQVMIVTRQGSRTDLILSQKI